VNNLSNDNNILNQSSLLNLKSFTSVKNILDNNPINESTQIKIEKHLNDQFINANDKKKSFIFNNISPNFRTFLYSEYDRLELYLDRCRNEIST
jgi:hypothetical protein